MTITRVWQSGAETGWLSEVSGYANNPYITSSYAKTGTYSFADGDQQRYMYADFGDTYAIRVGMYYYGNTSTSRDFLYWRNGGTDIAKAYFTSDVCHFYAPTGTWRGQMIGGNSVAWKHIAIDIYFNSSTGWMVGWMDGVQMFNVTGVNTGSTSCNRFCFGHFGGAGNYPCYYDDIYIDNTTGEASAAVMPILRFQPLLADGNGNYAEWDGSDGNSVDNYQLIDERPTSAGDYVETNVADEYDSYTLSTYTMATGETVKAIIPTVAGIRYGDTEQIALGTRYSSTDSIGSDQDLATGYNPGSVRWERQETKPGGGGWDQTSMDGAELVIKSRGSY